MRCLVTGATGYLGGRLVPRLLADGHEVRCLVRSPEKLRDVPWADQVEIVEGNVLGDLDEAMRDIEVVHYLVHSLHSKDFANADREAAENTAKAAERAGVQRIVYLGGLHPSDTELSPHLASRKEVGEVFLRSKTPAVVLQAAVIIGSGSASFEMVRYLTERLPVMVTPRWVHNRIQPIAMRDVLHYLVEATTLEQNRTFDIGGPDVLTYLEMIHRYALVAGLRERLVLPVPVLTPRLSSYWALLVTPVPGSVVRALIESLVHEVTCQEHDIKELLPGENVSYDEAVGLALGKVRDAAVKTREPGASATAGQGESLATNPADRRAP